MLATTRSWLLPLLCIRPDSWAPSQGPWRLTALPGRGSMKAELAWEDARLLPCRGWDWPPAAGWAGM